jgi:hypothetical protein
MFESGYKIGYRLGMDGLYPVHRGRGATPLASSYCPRLSTMRFVKLGIACLVGFAAASSPANNEVEEGGEYTDDGYRVASRDDGIPLRRVHHRHLYKKDGHHELFEPRGEMQLDVLMGMYAPRLPREWVLTA